jgi:hypothetical protein
VEWEISAYEGSGAWLTLGRTEGSDPQAALDSWVAKHGDEHQRYGVRAPGQDVWQPFGRDGTGGWCPLMYSSERRGELPDGPPPRLVGSNLGSQPRSRPCSGFPGYRLGSAAGALCGATVFLSVTEMHWSGF